MPTLPCFILTVTINCGEMSNENCTYFESNSPMPGGCSAKICPCNNNICQVIINYTVFMDVSHSSILYLKI